MFFEYDLIHDAISRKKPIKNLFNSTVDGLLDGYVVSDYVTTKHIPEIKLNGNPAKESARFFFKKYRYIAKLDISNTLIKYDFGSQYQLIKKFPYEFSVSFFDTFIAVEIEPDTLDTEYVVISPQIKNGNSSLEQRLEGVTAAISIISIYSSLNPGGLVALHVKIGELLEYLRSGHGKKKRFGIF